MSVKNLSKMFAPQSVAVIGATERPGSVGQSILQNLAAAKGRVRLFPVNPKYDEMAGVPCYPSASALPEVVDLAVICTPAATVPGLVRECGERGIRAILIITAGFREVGPKGKELEDQLRAEAAKFDGLRILGPNCLGFMVPHLGLNVSFVDQTPAQGSVAFVSQSGALCSSVLDWAMQKNIGFSLFVSFGNALDVGVADLLDYLSADPHTQSIVLYVESISDARRFMSAARAFTRDKPIIAYKAGRFAESAKAAASHTGATFSADPDRRRAAFESLDPGTNILSEAASKDILDAYGIPASRTLIAKTADEAIACANRLGYPVVFKLLSPDITHKSDVGGVVLNILDEAQARSAFDGILQRARERKPEARLEGVTVQPMIAQAHAHELIVGLKRDPIFGAVLMVGAGGVAAEINQDRALELPPLNERLARRMLESLRFWPLLKGYRGKPAVKIDKLIEVLMRLSYLAADNPEILELDINPLLATPNDIIALDARIVLDRAALQHPPPAYAHVAIRPYPNEFQQTARLKSGEEVLLRPILPEDEPLWLAMLERCSPETIRQRFRYMFKATTHEMAARFCFLDYDREIAIVAEHRTDGERQLLGVGRLVANAEHTQAEYAVLVTDDWQNRGLGSLLTDGCLDIARRWGLRRVVAEMASDNQRMASLFERRGFELCSIANDTLKAAKEL